MTVLLDGEPIKISVPGVVTLHDGNDGRVGCNNLKYNYLVVGTPAWPDPSLPPLVTAYWNWVYTGYTTGGPALDFSENCHGYAFGVGDWPINSSGLLNVLEKPAVFYWNRQPRACGILLESRSHENRQI